MTERELKYSRLSLEEIRLLLGTIPHQEQPALLDVLRLDSRKGVHNLIAQFLKQQEKEAAEEERLYHV